MPELLCNSLLEYTKRYSSFMYMYNVFKVVYVDVFLLMN